MDIRHAFAGGALAAAVIVFPAAPHTAGILPTSGPGLEAQAIANDPVVEWHQIFNAATLATVPVPSSLATSRSAALVSVSVFDALNGVDRWYAPYLVTERAPARTSTNASAIQAAYAMLLKLYPAQATMLTTRRDASIAALMTMERSESLQRGISWGQHVAEIVWSARQSDGLAPAMAPFMGSATIGFWRPTPPANSPGAGPQFATMTPWVLARPSQFRPVPPPALNSPAYAADFNETRIWGAAIGSPRRPEDSALAVFWSGNGTLYWTRVAAALAEAHHLPSYESAHLFAVLHLALADASIATWDAKYRYVFWRPVTAIRSLDDDGNSETAPDATWSPFLTTSAHPEYPSGHSNLVGAAATVLSAIFGDDVPFDATSETMPGSVRSFVGFDLAVDEMADARVFGGMHFRTACVQGSALGRTIASYVLSHAMRAIRQDTEASPDRPRQ
jgi:membrane-associated phospholipid phosphatase